MNYFNAPWPTSERLAGLPNSFVSLASVVSSVPFSPLAFGAFAAYPLIIWIVNSGMTGILTFLLNA